MNIYIHLDSRNGQRNPAEMSTDPIPNKTSQEYILKTINKHKKGPNSDIQVSPIREPEKRALDWRIISVKIVCFVFVVVSWFIVVAPYASLVRFFLSPEVNATNSVNTQMERIDSICGVINNSTLGFRGNRSSNLSLVCEYPYVTNGTLCVPICGVWHPGGPVYHVVTRVVSCVAASLSLICSLLGIATWFIIGKKLFEFPQVIPFYLFICASIQALCILIGQIQYERFYCSHEDLISSRSETTPQCYIQGAIYHYVSFVFVFWYVSYIVAVLLILSFPFKLRPTGSSNWKPHLILFLVSTLVPLFILIIFWGVDSTRYEIVIHPLVCLPEPTALVVTSIVPISLTLGLSLTSVMLIISQLIINHLRLRRHKTSTMNRKQNQFIIRTLGVIISFTLICLFLMTEFGARVSFAKPFESYVQLYWACITRYGTDTSCCVDNYNQFYHPELNVLSDFFFSIWGIVALTTLAVKEAREFWINLFSKCCRCCMHRVKSISKPELSSNSQTQQKRRMIDDVNSSEGNNSGGSENGTKIGTETSEL